MKNLKLLFTSALVVIVSVAVEAQNHKWRVNNTPDNKFIRKPDGTGICDHCFNDLATAVASPLLHDNDTLYVEATPFSYGNGITVNRPLTIIGSGYQLSPGQNANLQASVEHSIVQSFLINPSAAGTKLSGLYISAGGAGIHTILLKASNFTMERCYFDGVSLDNFDPLENVTITQSVGGSIAQTNTANDPINNLRITNNYIFSATLKQGHIGLFENNIVGNFLNGYSGMQYRNNIFLDGDLIQNDNNTNNVRNNTFGLTNWIIGTAGNTNEVEVPTSVFQTYPFTFDGHYQTKPDCATCSHGYPWPSPGGGLKGVFGGPTPYVRAGIPNVPTIYTLTTTGQVSSGGETPVTISTRTNNND